MEKKYPTVKLLKECPRGTSLSITLKINDGWENLLLFIKTGEDKWMNEEVAIPSQKLVTFIKELNFKSIVTIDPNLHTDGDKPIHVFNQGTYYTENNTGDLKGRKTTAKKSPARKTTRKTVRRA